MENLINIDDFFKVKLAVGTVKSAVAVPKSNKLLQLQVDLGEIGERQILSGIAKFYTPEQLIDTQVIVIINLQPVTIMGIESFGMLLATDNKENGSVHLLRPDSQVTSGSQVR